MTGRAIPILDAARALFGPLVWAAHFILVYAAESLLCRLLDGRSHTFLLAGATIAAFGAVLWDFRRQRRRVATDGVETFLSRMRGGLDALSAFAIILVALAGLELPACR